MKRLYPNQKLFAGIDLHSNNLYLGIIDQDNKRIHQRRVPCELDVVLAEFEPFREHLVGIVVESTYNWYWLVDGLMDNQYPVHLANPAAMQKYSGLKHSDDKYDAFWLADMLRLGSLPKGYIYPKEDRPIRDLLRKRCFLVQLRTSAINNLQGMLCRTLGHGLSSSLMKRRVVNHVDDMLCDQAEDLRFNGIVSKKVIDVLSNQIECVETVVLGELKLRPAFIGLNTIPGVGKILALTIMLETGEIGRFPKVGNFSSYCRKVPTGWLSNNKKKGKGNSKNGNKYLAWAFSEAAELARRFDPRVRAYFNRKASKSNRMVAHAALAHKLARTAYIIMRDGRAFDHDKLFAA